jgi:hypothetical protein
VINTFLMLAADEYLSTASRNSRIAVTICKEITKKKFTAMEKLETNVSLTNKMWGETAEAELGIGNR